LVFFVVAIIDSFSVGVPLAPRLTAPPGNWFRVIVARTAKSFRCSSGTIRQAPGRGRADGGAARFPLLGFVSRACGGAGGSAMTLKEAAVGIVLITAIRFALRG
jgi:hypothetical protein